MARQTGHLFSYRDIKLHFGVSDAEVRLRPVADLHYYRVRAELFHSTGCIGPTGQSVGC